MAGQWAFSSRGVPNRFTLEYEKEVDGSFSGS